jgi:hypothetical protein
MNNVTGRIENWHVSMPDESGEIMVWGDVYGSYMFNDGTYIHTSGCPNTEYKEGDIVTTRNSTYLLGKKVKMSG